ncbi:Serine/threonine-protein kinase PknB [Aquisphaera giovannonii]|uniref:non-specific serine/threonine protein kinase n=1 Tax=Aquisphaera giovannonii TaxID=406548 RepID=A0A5B9VU47_9BACT|nr:serine/threonine-protein kinase [Aquisphaera giovannonii]QEH31852.1 Serine/threonine-protein kinase PknB [Aquisphaera giovannonii]
MSPEPDLADLLDARLDGHADDADVPESFRIDLARALAAHEAIRDALEETILLPGGEPASDREPPRLPDDYEVVRELGHGGMGVVYLARQRSLGRQVAVKVLRPGEMAFGPMLRRFEEEARHLARLRHPNIVAIHEVGRSGGEPYFTMDYIEGQSLSARLAAGVLTPSQALAILRPAAEAVRHAHERGIIHRDLKPSNILLDGGGRAFVTDFGLARDMAGSSGVTRSGEVMGTPAYMAPEQALGQADRIGEATDVHALGAILYEMLAGRPPYGHDAPARVLARLLDAQPEAPRRIDRRIPRDLETICLKMLEKEPARRYATVGALLEDLRRFDEGRPPLARRPGPALRAGRWLRRHGTAIAAVLLVAAAAAGLAWSLLPRRTEVQVQVEDRTADSLIAEANARHAAGDHALAARLFTAAARQAPADRRPAILRDVVRCVGELSDRAAALQIAADAIELAPDLSFGAYDPLLASVADDRTRAVTPVHRSGRTPGEPEMVAELRAEDRPVVELAQTRLELVAKGNFSDDVRRDAEDRLVRIRRMLRNEPSPGTWRTIPAQIDFPKGTADELHRRSLDSSVPRWDRARAAYAEGRTRAEAGDRPGALEAYRRAFELIRCGSPTYPEPAPASAPRFDPPEARFLLDIEAAIRALDPAAPSRLKGGLRFRLTGLELPPGVSVFFSPSLVDPALDPKLAGNGGGFLPNVHIGRERTAWLGVADGHYRLSVPAPGKSYGHDGRADEATERSYHLLDVDYSDLPAEVEIRGETVDLPPLRARLLEEIKLLAPADRAAFDPNEGIFRWSPVPRASRYQFALGAITVSEGGSTTKRGLGGYDTASTSLCLGTAPEQNQVLATLSRELKPGTIGEWTVQAFDASGRKLATVAGPPRNFVVARSLERGRD